MTTKVTTVTPYEAYFTFKKHGAGFKKYLQDVSTQLSGDITGLDVIGISKSIKIYDNLLNNLAVVGGIAKAAKAIEGDDLYEPTVEWPITRALMDDVVTVVQAAPTAGLITGWDATSGDVVWNIYTPAQTASFKTSVDALIASMD